MFFNNRCYDKEYPSMDGNMNAGMTSNNCGCTCEPVMECPQERVCHREMCYEVPHVSPFM